MAPFSGSRAGIPKFAVWQIFPFTKGPFPGTPKIQSKGVPKEFPRKDKGLSRGKLRTPVEIGRQFPNPPFWPLPQIFFFPLRNPPGNLTRRAVFPGEFTPQNPFGSRVCLNPPFRSRFGPPKGTRVSPKTPGGPTKFPTSLFPGPQR